MTIGQPLQKINHICRADDYNKLVTVIQPFQNLTFGTGINGYITPNGISISTVKALQENNFPFKVTQKDSEKFNIRYGRVYEGKPGESTGYTELTPDFTFDPVSGYDIDIDDKTLVIAINEISETTDSFTTFKIDYLENITTGYWVAHVIANITKDTNNIYNIEQVLGYDFTIYSVTSQVDEQSININSDTKLQVRKFEDNDQSEDGLLDVLTITDGALTLTDSADKYELLVRVTDSEGEVKAVGYMPFGEPTYPTDPTAESIPCGQQPYPGDGGGGGSGDGSSHKEGVYGDQDDADPSGQGGSGETFVSDGGGEVGDGSTNSIYEGGTTENNDSDYPGKSNDCW